MLTLNTAALNTDLPSTLSPVWETVIRPVAGHYRLDHMSFHTLEDLRKRLVRQGTSYRDFRASVLPCLEAIFAVSPEQAHPDTPFFSKMYPEITLPFDQWAEAWRQTLEDNVSPATRVRYDSVLNRYLLSTLDDEDLTLLDGARTARLRTELHLDQSGESLWRQVCTVLYAVLDYGVVHAALAHAGVPFRTAAQDWLESTHEYLAPNTVDAYQTIVTKYMLPLLGDRPLFAFDTRSVLLYRNQILGIGMSGSRFYIHLSVLRSILDHAAKRGWIDTPPTLHISVLLYRNQILGIGMSGSRFYIHLSVLRSILDHAAKRGWIDTPPTLHISSPKRKLDLNFPDVEVLEAAFESDHSWPACFIVQLAWKMGLTREEIRDLTWDDVDLTQRTAQIDGRTIPIPNVLIPAFQDAHRQTGGIGNVVRSIRGKYLTSENISMNARKFLSNHGMDHVRLLDLRHGYILRSIDSLGPDETARRCGYKSAEIMMRIYGKLSKRK